MAFAAFAMAGLSGSAWGVVRLLGWAAAGFPTRARARLSPLRKALLVVVVVLGGIYTAVVLGAILLSVAVF